MRIGKIAIAIGVCVILALLLSYASIESDTKVRLARFVKDVGPKTLTMWAQTQVSAWKDNPSQDYNTKIQSVKLPPCFDQLSSYTRTRVYQIRMEERSPGEIYVVLLLITSIFERHTLSIGDPALLNQTMGEPSKDTVKFADGIWYQFSGAQ